jgi:hypothetical protein
MELQANQREKHEGGCLCGNVRYVTHGSPRYQAVCHCTFCQRVTGSAYLVEAESPRLSWRPVSVSQALMA